jgi:hypothetical protein
MTFIVNLWDKDGTLCKSIFNNDRLKNDNKNCLSPDFLKDLANEPPFPWLKREQWRFIGMNIMVTGELPQHEDCARTWFVKHTGVGLHGYVSVPWDDSKQTREASYQDYVARKVEKLSQLVTDWCAVMYQSGFPDYEIHVYEDDTNVLAEMRKHLYYKDTDKGLHVVDDKGEVHPYP